MDEHRHKHLYYRVPQHYSRTAKLHEDPAKDEYIHLDVWQSDGGPHSAPAVKMIRILRDGSLEAVQTERERNQRTYLGVERWISDNEVYFGALAAILNGNCKKITEKQFKAERMRRI